MLTFEALDESHANALYPEFSEEESFRYTAGKRSESFQALRQEFVGLRVQATMFGDGALWIGYRIIRSASGRGVATAAVQWLQSTAGMMLRCA